MMVECKICGRSFKDVRFLGIHLKSHKLKPKEYYDKYLKSENEGICQFEDCKNETNFLYISKGYNRFCCRDHANKDENSKKEKEKSFLERFGTTHPYKNKEFVKQKQDEYFERNGIRSSNEKLEVKEKISEEISKFWLSEKGTKIKKVYSKNRKGKKRTKEICENIKEAVNKPESKTKHAEIVNSTDFKKKRGKSMKMVWKKPEVRKRYIEGREKSEKVKEARKRWRKIMLAGMAGYISSFNKTISKPQKKLFELAKQLFFDAELNKPVCNRGYLIDIAIPSIMVAIEYDGSYWHKNQKEYDRIRQDYLEFLGWKVLRYEDYVPTLENLKNDIHKLIGR